MQPAEFPDISIYAAPLYLLLIGAEIWWMGRKGDGARSLARRDLWTNLAMGAGNVAASLTLFGGITALSFWVWQHRQFDLGLGAGAIFTALIAKDFVYYWTHRLQHRIRWCWASHVIHHSSQGYNLSTALRQPWFSVTTGTYLLGLPVILLGVHPALYAFAGGINLFYQFFVHTEVVTRLPAWVEAVFNTPSHHRVHHAVNPPYLDTNYGGILIIWDRLFGTFSRERADEPCDYGLVSNIESQHPFHVATHEYRAILRDASRPGLRPAERFRYCFAAPGYSHDGSRFTSAAIKARAAEKRRGTRVKAAKPVLVGARDTAYVRRS